MDKDRSAACGEGSGASSAPSPSAARPTASHPFGRSALRLLKDTLSRFVSIMLITVIGVAFFSGLRVTGDYMRANADVYLNSVNAMDIRIVSTYGFDRADIDAIRATPGVRDAYAGYNINVMAYVTDGAVSSQVLSIDPRPEPINTPWLFSGRVPERSGECLVEKDYLRHSGKKLGDHVVFESGDDSDLSDLLKRDTFTIVGVVDSPLFLAEDRGSSDIGNGSNSYFFLVLEADFALSVRTEVYLRLDEVAADDSRFSPEYHSAIGSGIVCLEQTASERSPLRFADVVAEATATLDDAQAEVDQGYADLEDAAQELADARRELDEGWAELDDARLKLDDGWAASAAGRRELDEGWAELADARTKIDEGLAELAEGRPALDDGWAELAQARQELDGGWAEANAALAELEAAREQLDTYAWLIESGWALLDQLAAWGVPQWLIDLTASGMAELEQLYSDGLAEWQAGYDLYLAGVQVLQEGEADYAEWLAYLEGAEADWQAGMAALEQADADYAAGLADIRQGEADYAAGLAELKQAEADYAQGLADIEQGEADYAEGLSTFEKERDEALVELADAQADIDQAWADLEALKPPQWYVLSIRDNAGFRTFESEAAQLDALAFILPAFFFLIAALVSMTAMTRLVDAERTTIATFKALGYQNTAISLRYLLYALTATVLGSAAGVALGYSILPPMIFDAFRTLFNIPHTVSPLSAEYTAISAAVAIVAAVVPALFVVRSSVRESPAQAMRPLAPKAGRRILLERLRPVWRRMSFLQKVTARNLFRYKKRLLMTVFGVAGCTALIFTALALHDSLGSVTAKQFGMIYRSDVTLDFRLKDGQVLGDLLAKLDTCPDTRAYTPVYQRSMRITSPEMTKDLSLIVALNPDELPDFISLAPRRTGLAAPPEYSLTDDGVILTEQIARQFGLKPGDRLTLRTLEGDEASFTLAGIVENYTLHYCYMTPAVYEAAFGEAPDPNRIFVLSRSGRGELDPAILADPAVTSVMYTSVLAGEVDNQLDVLTFVVIILIASAAILIFVVLFSLTTINIEERRRELASIQVLGFTDLEVASYIYRENVVLTVLGAIVGIGLGFLLQRYIITTLEIDMFMFSRDIFWTSYAISLALTFLFAAAVNLMMYRPLTQIGMVESLKAVE